MANSDIKELGRPLPLSKYPSSYIQPRIRGGVGSPIQFFSCDVLQKLVRLTPLHTMRSCSASKSISSFWRWMMNPHHLHIIAWSSLKMFPQTQTDGVSGTSQSYLSFTAFRTSFLFKPKFISLIGKKVSQLEVPFCAAKSTALKVFPEIEPFTSPSFSLRYWFFTCSISRCTACTSLSSGGSCACDFTVGLVDQRY